MMKGFALLMAVATTGVGCSGSAGDEGSLESVQSEVAAPYSALSDGSNGGTAGFFIFSPWGDVTDGTAFPGTPFAFATSRLKAAVVHLASCDPNGPTEDPNVFALLPITATSGNKFQMSKNTASIGTGLVAGECYRVKLTLDGFAMGFTDVQLVVGAAAATAPFHRLVTGSNFVVKFRTESSLNTDTDSDTVPDWRDNCPVDANTDQADSNANGIGDVCEPVIDNCPNDPNKLEPGICGCGVADTDSDNDGTADCLDGCPADPFKTGSGGCGCGNIDIDTDGDGQVDGCSTVANRCGP